MYAIRSYYDAQIAENPDDYHGYYLKAVMLSESGDQAQAKMYANQSLKMKASTFEAHMRIGAIVGCGEQDIVNLLSNYGIV